ncbi:MAG TPA: Uma2 family endonuclease [Thermoanaerobaculia bacterium]|nr:Uma2 family endonuclease [Thermoanaerobaculia bacterium]
MSEPADLVALSYEDYRQLPDDGRRYELIERDLYVTAAPVPRHQRVVIRLAHALEGWSLETGEGQVLTSPIDVVLAENTVVQPDLLVVMSAHADRIGARGIEGAPDIVAEVVSESSRRHDEVTKRHLYGKYGVEEYWILDPTAASVRTFRRSSGGLLAPGSELTVAAGDRLTTVLLPGFSADLSRIFG